MDDLKRKARQLGIWNMFLPKNHFKDGPQFSNVEYGLMAEQLGKSTTASEVCDRCEPSSAGAIRIKSIFG
jgi:acyl-CoA dehydrogenase